MNTTQSTEMAEVLDRVKHWPSQTRLELIRRVLESLDERPRSFPLTLQDLIGMGAGDSTPPSDETSKQWIHEHRMEKYR